VIPAIHPRGTRVGGLLRYLFGPGKREEHVNPRLIAVWDGAGDLTQLQPPPLANGRHDVRRVAELLEQPVRSGWNPPAKTVWHCSIRNHSTDRILSDGQWSTQPSRVRLRLRVSSPMGRRVQRHYGVAAQAGRRVSDLERRVLHSPHRLGEGQVVPGRSKPAHTGCSPRA
jgi:hypothetical protein